MNVYIKKKQYWVTWKHHLPVLKLWKRKYRVEKQGFTFCRIYDDAIQGAPKPVCVGHAVCRKEDNYCKDTGRLISLQRAIKDFDEVEKEMFLVTYLYRK